MFHILVQWEYMYSVVSTVIFEKKMHCEILARGQDRAM